MEQYLFFCSLSLGNSANSIPQERMCAFFLCTRCSQSKWLLLVLVHSSDNHKYVCECVCVCVSVCVCGSEVPKTLTHCIFHLSVLSHPGQTQTGSEVTSRTPPEAEWSGVLACDGLLTVLSLSF